MHATKRIPPFSTELEYFPSEVPLFPNEIPLFTVGKSFISLLRLKFLTVGPWHIHKIPLFLEGCPLFLDEFPFF